MKFTDKSYRTSNLRPKPIIHQDEVNNILIIVTPWGNKVAAEKAIKSISEHLISYQQDVEATSPFNLLTCLSPLANNLRSALKLANDIIYREDNKKEFTAGIEILTMIYNQHEICWSQVGFPSLFLSRNGQKIRPLGAQIDLTAEFQKNTTLAPLPGKLLGIENTSDFAVHSMKFNKNDKFFFVSSTDIAPQIYNLDNTNHDVEEISKSLANTNPETPFWLGQLSF